MFVADLVLEKTFVFFSEKGIRLKSGTVSAAVSPEDSQQFFTTTVR